MTASSFIVENYLNVARGRVPGASVLHRFGANIDTDAGTETIWTGGGLYPWSAWDNGASVLAVESNSASDNGETLIITGLNADFEPVSDSIVLGNQTPANTTVEFIRVLDMYGASNGGVSGRVTASIDGTTVAHIPAGKNQTISAIYTVPAGKTGYIFYGDASVSKNGDGVVEFFVRLQSGGGFRIQHLGELFQNTYSYPFPVPLKLPPKTDLDVRFETPGNNARVTAAFDILLVDGA